MFTSESHDTTQATRVAKESRKADVRRVLMTAAVEGKRPAEGSVGEEASWTEQGREKRR